MELSERIAPPQDLDSFSEIIDVRSPAEFAEDHLPGAVNLPVLDNEQRHEVGLLYKKDRHAARFLGALYVTAAIHRHLEKHFSKVGHDYAPLIYCWRGGMRSGSMATILRNIGWRVRVLEGGYQAWRRFLMEDLEARLPAFRFPVLGGLTGVGKTHLLHDLAAQGAQILDLEGLAEHRGSLLGLPPESEQPSQKLFESRLWHQPANLDPEKPVFTEAESNRIGRIHCPAPLWQQLARARVATVELPLEARVQLLRHDYPHFIQNPDSLKPLIDKLRPHRGHERVDYWHELIAQNDWSAFLADILQEHYDRAYRPPGHETSNYPAPGQKTTLPDLSPAALAQAARTLIQNSPNTESLRRVK